MYLHELLKSSYNEYIRTYKRLILKIEGGWYSNNWEYNI
jgi:hypothetical protein